MATIEDLEKRIKILEDAVRALSGTAAGVAPVSFGFRRVENDLADLGRRVAELEEKIEKPA